MPMLTMTIYKNFQLHDQRKKDFTTVWFRLYSLSFEGIYVRAGGESHVDSNSDT